MKYIYLAVGWIFGVSFAFSGIGLATESPLGGLIVIAASLFLIPPARDFVYSKTNRSMSLGARVGTVVGLLFIASLIVGQDASSQAQRKAEQEAQAQAELAAQAKQANIDYYNQHKEEILAKAGEALAAKDYKSVVEQTNKYLAAGDEQLKRLNTKAAEIIAAEHKAERTDSILTQLKSVPASEYEQNKNLYNQLVAMHPDNAQYKEKLAHYNNKIAEEQRAIAAAAAKKEQIKKQFSAWDGSHYNLERLIKKAMNDPDSYQHDETVYWDMGDYLVVKTTYRGKNAFGGVVKNFVKAKVSLNGDILAIMDES